MPRRRNIKVFMDDQILEGVSDSSSAQVRFELFRRQQEIQEIFKILQQLSDRGKNEQVEWLKQNEDFVTAMADDFVDDSLFQLDGVKLDSETLQLSVEVMTQLKETLGLFQTIVSGEDNLEA